MFLLWIFCLWYMIKSGDCQIRAKYYSYYQEDTPLQCFKNINYLK